MPDYVVSRTIEALNSKKRPVNGSKVLLVGLAYKADVDDIRESPTFVLMDKLEALGAQVAFYDPLIRVIGPTREHAQRQGMQSVEWNAETLRAFDAAIIVTAHRDVDYAQLAAACDCIIDTRNVHTGPGQVWKA
jgi:UDP-N-acetyl-D-glucosamine dehydrogenase